MSKFNFQTALKKNKDNLTERSSDGKDYSPLK